MSSGFIAWWSLSILPQSEPVSYHAVVESCFNNCLYLFSVFATCHRWPFKRVSQSVYESKPDVIMHMGGELCLCVNDYSYYCHGSYCACLIKTTFIVRVHGEFLVAMARNVLQEISFLDIHYFVMIVQHLLIMMMGMKSRSR